MKEISKVCKMLLEKYLVLEYFCQKCVKLATIESKAIRMQVNSLYDSLFNPVQCTYYVSI